LQRSTNFRGNFEGTGGSYNLNGERKRKQFKEVMLSEATSVDTLDQVDVGHGGFFGSSISCCLFGLDCIFRCLTPKLSITGGSNIAIPSLFVFMGPLERE
jgi:hypothetical protein